MNGRAKEIFRDGFNMIESGCNLEEFKRQSKAIVSKYTDVKDVMLCTELFNVIADHIVRRDRM